MFINWGSHTNYFMDLRDILFGVELTGICVYSVTAALGLTLVALAPLIISFFRHDSE